MKKNVLVIFVLLTMFGAFSKVQALILCEKPWEVRHREYNNFGNKRVFVFSPSRTGSTLTFNVLRFLFDTPSKRCIKLHDLYYRLDNEIVFVSVRNPIDSACSVYRVDEKGHEIDEERILAISNMLIKQFRDCLFLLRNFKSVYLLEYEKDIKHIPNLLRKIEMYLGLKIDYRDKQYIQETFSKKKVLKFIQEAQYKHFLEHNYVDHIHGNHILTPENDILEEIYPIIIEKFKENFSKEHQLFEQFGYKFNE